MITSNETTGLASTRRLLALSLGLALFGIGPRLANASSVPLCASVSARSGMDAVGGCDGVMVPARFSEQGDTQGRLKPLFVDAVGYVDYLLPSAVARVVTEDSRRASRLDAPFVLDALADQSAGQLMGLPGATTGTRRVRASRAQTGVGAPDFTGGISRPFGALSFATVGAGATNGADAEQALAVADERQSSSGRLEGSALRDLGDSTTSSLLQSLFYPPAKSADDGVHAGVAEHLLPGMTPADGVDSVDAFTFAIPTGSLAGHRDGESVDSGNAAGASVASAVPVVSADRELAIWRTTSADPASGITEDVPVPEPASLLLLLGGGLAMVLARRRSSPRR